MVRLLSLLLAITLFIGTQAFAGSVATLDKDELKNLLGSENVVVLDVRLGRDWSSSEFKIKNAVRIDDGDLSVAEEYPKETTFVLYCA